MSDEMLEGERVHLRPVRPDDRDRLTALFNEPEVLRWWGDAEESLDDTFNPAPEEVGYVVESEGEFAGFIQYGEESEPMYRHASIDIALGEGARGRGLGADAIRTLATYLFEVRGHHRLTIDPAADNAKAIRSYERLGFRPVGIMRRYERGLDGTWHDGLLMDLLAGELR
jgi:aminoglycoside 6'-N-acetyltransferase